MRIWGLMPLIIALSLGACNSEGDKANERVEFLKKHGATAGEVCDAAKSAAKAYGDAQDAQHYETAKFQANTDCLNAEMFGAEMPYGTNTEQEPDNMEAMPDNTGRPS